MTRSTPVPGAIEDSLPLRCTVFVVKILHLFPIELVQVEPSTCTSDVCPCSYLRVECRGPRGRTQHGLEKREIAWIDDTVAIQVLIGCYCPKGRLD